MLPDPFSPQPLVSALVSSYAAGRFMRGLLEDLEAQTLADQLEIVIVDSNSPENEGEIVAEFQQRYDNIVYLRTEERENSHVSLNRCLQLARGKYVTLANTDDRHVPDAFERLAALLEARTDAALAYADIALTKNEEDIICNRRQEDAEIMAYFRWPEFNPLSFFQQCYAGPQPMWRHSLHDKHGGFDPEFFYAGDYEFWLRLVSRGEIFVHLPAVLGTMLHTISSNSNANVDALGEESERARQRYWPPQMGPVPKKDGPAYLKLAEPYAQNQPERYPTKEPI
ncbi:MAG TPA: glycosyltransferase, partial [Candidatus Obscuribacterales bacterium]